MNIEYITNCKPTQIEEKPHISVTIAPDVKCGICYETITSAPQHMFCCHSMHTLHSECLIKWLALQHFEERDCCCPFCRKTLMTAREFNALYHSTPSDTEQPQPESVVVSVPVDRINAMRFVRITYQTHVCMLLNVLLLLILLFSTKK